MSAINQDELLLAMVAEVYEEAVEDGSPPVEAVAATWECHSATASEWVRRARRKGLLAKLPKQSSVAEYTQTEYTQTLMSPADLATYLGVPLETVYRWRTRGGGPRGLKVGKHVRYRKADIKRWLDARADGYRS